MEECLKFQKVKVVPSFSLQEDHRVVSEVGFFKGEKRERRNVKKEQEGD